MWFKKFISNPWADTLFSKSFLTLIGFSTLLFGSWFLLSDPNLKAQQEEQKHSQLQMEFQNILSEFIETKHPEVSEIHFQKIWTKKTEESSKVKIYFTYSLVFASESGGVSELEGSALLLETENTVWQVQDFQIEKTRVEFTKAIEIKTNY